ncbi:hypothetical protein L596_026286 [Steinernema carpocapsae]|uniref:Uncharacterized protein n=1 Tax=Steinernema carpocapsae TaxID=34508 RepID=A0A4U5M0W6_STECR|nr:hypothetical protein L596_026286 [Steinernema carpocapsae]
MSGDRINEAGRCSSLLVTVSCHLLIWGYSWARHAGGFYGDVVGNGGLSEADRCLKWSLAQESPAETDGEDFVEMPPSRSRKRPKTAEQHQREELRYYHKILCLHREIRATVYTNAAMVDEVSRLTLAIVRAEAENKSIIQRLRNHERNRIRRIKNHHNREDVAAAAAAQATPKTPISVPPSPIAAVENASS